MSNITLLASLSKPSGLWPLIINGINNGVLNFGWTIVLFTIIVRIAMSPLDFLMRWSSKKTTLAQKKLQPQVDKINKKYANNKQQASVQTQALYKREGVHMVGSCLFSLLYLALTMVVFFTLFADLRKYSAYQVLDQYNKMEAKYDEVLLETGDAQVAGDAAATVWKQNKDGWLWIENIWRADTQENPVPTYAALKKIVSSGKYKAATARMKEITEDKYNEVTSVLTKSEKSHWNGYYILAILSIGLTFLSQFISELGNNVGKNKKKERTNKFYKYEAEGKADSKAQTGAMAGGLKWMKYIMPVIMAIFVITSSASFGIYIVASSAISTLTNLLINYLVKRATKKQEEETLAVLEKLERKNAK